jgi:tellurite resistance protein
MSAPASERLENLPVSLFSVVMGLAGLTLAWQRAEGRFEIAVSPWLAALTAGVFVLLATLYAAKLLRHPQAVAKEFSHPLKLSFFPTFSIALVLLAAVFLPHAARLSYSLWALGAALHLAFTLAVMSIWVRHTGFEITHVNPAWFIPVVGNIVVPIAGVVLGEVEVSWFFFAVGLVFWLVLLTIIFYRMIFHAPLPERMVPTLFILLAPPAAGFLSYVELAGGLDAFARVLYYTALFLFLLLAVQARLFLRLKFALSWWAYSFPLAALTLATLRMQRLTGAEALGHLGDALLALLTALLALLVVLTLRAVARREICVAEG